MTKIMNGRRFALGRWSLLLLLAAIAVVIGISVVRQFRATRAVYREELLRFVSRVELSGERDAIMDRPRSPALTVKRLLGPDVRVETPLEFGATNWTAVIACDADGKVIGIGIRTQDSDRIRPPGAPIDRVLPGHEETWNGKFGAINKRLIAH